MKSIFLMCLFFVSFVFMISCSHKKEENYQFNFENFIKEFCDATKSSEINNKFSNVQCLCDLYKKNNYKPIWLTADTLNENGCFAINQLTNAYQYGLDPQFYHVKTIRFYLKKLENAINNKKEMAKVMVELVLTDSYLLFCNHLSSGWSKPDGVTLNSNNCQFNQEILMKLKSHKMDEIAQVIECKQVHYINYRKAISKFFNSITYNNFVIPFVAQDSARAYQLVAKRLEGLNILNKNDVNNYSKIRLAIKKYKYLFGLEENFVLDSNTIKSLNRNFDDYRNQSIMVTEKLKHFDEKHDNFVLINIPTYTLFWVELGELAATHKVVVGTVKNQTPELVSTISKFTLFPEWNVPYKIATKEILPCVKNNVKYLDKHKYVISTGKGKDIDPSTVNWKKLGNSNFPYRVRQTSGEHNSLGILKFFFSNSNDVYLHDTPQKNYFNRTIRSFSHGCMRLHRPFEFLKLVLEYQQGLYHLSDEKLKEKNLFETQKRKFKKVLEEKENIPMVDTINVHLAKRTKKDFFLKRAIPIHVCYFSSFYDMEGNVLFYSDIYKRDSLVNQELNNFRNKQIKIWN